jgi:multicomponent Na+:H+ antiporter subunit A
VIRPSVILETWLQVIVPTALVFSVYLLMAGHNAPGGGFVGGLVAGTALVLRWLSDGRAMSGLRLRIQPTALLGAGLVLSAGVAAAGWLWDRPTLTHGKVEGDLALFGPVKVTSALPFDVGVYLVVVGLVHTLLSTIGAEDPGAEQPGGHLDDRTDPTAPDGPDGADGVDPAEVAP